MSGAGAGAIEMPGASVQGPGVSARPGGARALSLGAFSAMPRGALVIIAAVVAVGVALGLIWSVIGTLSGIEPDGPPDILAPANGYSGGIGWSRPGSYMPLAIAGLIVAFAGAAAYLLRQRRRAAMLVGFAGLAIAISLALPLSPLHDALAGATADPRAGLAGPFRPWMITAFFAWAVGLLFLALLSERHSWALFFYALMWTFWIPPAVMSNLPSLGLERPPVAQNGATEQLMNSRLADRLRNAGTVPLENGSLMSLMNTGAMSLAPGASASQASRPPRLPVFKVDGASHTSYLRTGTGDVYENGKWQSFPALSVPIPEGADFGASIDKLAAGGAALAKALPAGIQPGLLTPSTGAAHAYQEALKISPPPGADALGPGIVPFSPFPSTAGFDSSFDPLSGTLSATESVPEAAWQAEVPAYSEEELRNADFADAPAYLQLPPDVPQRVKDLARDVTRLERTPYAKARAIERYLKSNYRYGFADEEAVAGGVPEGAGAAATGVGQVPGGSGGAARGGATGSVGAGGVGGPAGGIGAGNGAAVSSSADPVDQFLFEQRTGTCGNFSSAFVVMARAAGIPARVVSGWSISPTSEPQTVRADQAHQWAEVAFSPLGWVPFEPTPADGAPGRAAEVGGEPPVARESAGDAPPRVAEAPSIAPAIASPTPVVQAPGAAGQPDAGSQAPSRTPLAVPPPSQTGGSKPPGGVPAGGAGTPGASPTASPGPSPSPSPGSSPSPVASRTPRSATSTPAASRTPIATATPTPIILIETSTEIQAIDPPRLRAGDSGTVSGIVTAASGEPVSGLRVEIFINREKAQGGLPIGDALADQGRFAVEVHLPADLPVGKYQVIAHAVANERYEESWSDPEVEVFAGTLIRWRGPVDVVVGDPATFAGTLTTDAGVPIPGATVRVTAEGRTLELTTAADGAFSARVSFERTGRQDVTARFAGSDLNLPQDATLAVTARKAAELEAHWPATIGPAEDFTVTGTLRSRGGAPETGRTVEITVRGIAAPQKVTTDGSGAFAWSHQFEDLGTRRITVSHGRTDSLESAAVTGEFAVAEAASGGSGPMVAAGIAVALAAGFGAGIAVMVVARRRGPRDPLDLPGTAGAPADTARGADGPGSGDRIAGHAAATRLPVVMLRIELPQVAPDLPPVWGVGEPLEIRAVATTAGGPAEGVTVRFQAGHGAAETAPTDSQGVASVTCTFREIGSIELSCRVPDAPAGSSSASLQLQIVDYRHEVVRLYNDYMDGHRRAGKVGASVTPRDAEAVLIGQALVSDQTSLDLLVSAFEEADYSEHPISRTHYERARRAWQQLKAAPPVQERQEPPEAARVTSAPERKSRI